MKPKIGLMIDQAQNIADQVGGSYVGLIQENPEHEKRCLEVLRESLKEALGNVDAAINERKGE